MTDPRTAPTQQFPPFDTAGESVGDTAREPAGETTRSRPVRAGTVVWGLILLGVAAVAFVVTAFDAVVVTSEVIVWTIVGVGAVLVVAGLIGGITHTLRRRDDD